jgi:hypothetical protein
MTPSSKTSTEAERCEIISALLGTPYTAQYTISGRLFDLENAVLAWAEQNPQAAVGLPAAVALSKRANDAIAAREDVLTELATAKAKIAELEGHLTVAKSDSENAFKRGHAEAMAGVEKAVEMRAAMKAAEIARAVGQPIPGEEIETASSKPAQRVDPIETVASGYRHKYGIS